MAILKTEELEITSTEDVSHTRQKVRQYTVEAGFNLVEQTKMITAASELSRNIVQHGGSKGTVTIYQLEEGNRRGVKAVFKDNGPGIADVDLAMRDGYTTGTGLGMGLGGSKRLVNEFQIQSTPGQGTTVTIVRWK